MTQSPFIFPPLDRGAQVVMDVNPDGPLAYDGPHDLLVVAVPAGDGVAVETALCRLLNFDRGDIVEDDTPLANVMYGEAAALDASERR